MVSGERLRLSYTLIFEISIINFNPQKKETKKTKATVLLFLHFISHQKRKETGPVGIDDTNTLLLSYTLSKARSLNNTFSLSLSKNNKATHFDQYRSPKQKSCCGRTGPVYSTSTQHTRKSIFNLVQTLCSLLYDEI